MQGNSRSIIFSEKAQQPVVVSKSENVKVTGKSCENNQNVIVKMPEKKSVNSDEFRLGIRCTRSWKASVPNLTFVLMTIYLVLLYLY